MKLFAKLTDLPDGHPDIIPDMQKRYVGSYMKYGDLAVYVNNVSNQGNCVFSDLMGREFVIDHQAEDENQLVPYLPKVGYYNVNGNPVYIAKHPERQWRRSFGKHIYQLMQTMDGLLQQFGNNVWGQIAQEAINPEYVRLSDINHKLFANIALSHEFAVVMQNKTPWLVYKRYPIGTLDITKKQIKLTQPLLRQEVMDMLKRNGDVTWALI